jgi:hypothetical protein
MIHQHERLVAFDGAEDCDRTGWRVRPLPFAGEIGAVLRENRLTKQRRKGARLKEKPHQRFF